MKHWNNLVEAFAATVSARPDAPFLWAKSDGAFRPQSRGAVATEAASLATALRALGVKEGDRVALIAENRPEWCIADIAIMAAGAISVPAYTTYTTRDYVHILSNADVAAVIVSTARLAKLVLAAVQGLGHIRAVITMEHVPVRQNIGCAVHHWPDLIAAHPATLDGIRPWWTGLTRADVACLIYTSGTGGAPKGVMVSHGGILHNCAAAELILADTDIEEGVFLSFLPLSHAYEHTAGQCLPMVIGGQIYYAESLEKLAANMEEAKPHIMVVVPRLFEMLRMRVLKAVEKEGGLKLKLFEKSIELGARRAEGEKLGLMERFLDHSLDVLVRDKIRARFGGRMKALVSGGAPLSADVGRFFKAIGLPILQGYGQTEASPIISCNPLIGGKVESVGLPLAHTEVKIAEDGEILVKGELVMNGYWADEQATANTIRDGWLHTGDVGHLDADGHLVITDRKKDIIVNDKGDNVSPARIEGLLTLEPEIAQAMVYGDRRPHLVGLIVPDTEWFDGWKKKAGKVGAVADLRRDADLHAALAAAVARVNASLSNLEKVRRFDLAEEAFSVENGEMTPTLKVRRHLVVKRYKVDLDALY